MSLTLLDSKEIAIMRLAGAHAAQTLDTAGSRLAPGVTTQEINGDTSRTFFVGTPSADARHVVEVAQRCLASGMAEVRPGARLGDIGAAIVELATQEGCSVVRDYCGHGIGRKMHLPPQVHHTGQRGRGLRLRAGMVFTIEPMINLGGADTQRLKDGWTVVTADRSLSAQFEHTLLVTHDGFEILTPRPSSKASPPTSLE